MTAKTPKPERAEAAWVEVREDGVPLLCYETERATTDDGDSYRRTSAVLGVVPTVDEEPSRPWCELNRYGGFRDFRDLRS
jgi:hypothetical protein